MSTDRIGQLVARSRIMGEKQLSRDKARGKVSIAVRTDATVAIEAHWRASIDRMPYGTVRQMIDAYVAGYYGHTR